MCLVSVRAAEDRQDAEDRKLREGKLEGDRAVSVLGAVDTRRRDEPWKTQLSPGASERWLYEASQLSLEALGKETGDGAVG